MFNFPTRFKYLVFTWFSTNKSSEINSYNITKKIINLCRSLYSINLPHIMNLKYSTRNIGIVF